MPKATVATMQSKAPSIHCACARLRSEASLPAWYAAASTPVLPSLAASQSQVLRWCAYTMPVDPCCAWMSFTRSCVTRRACFGDYLTLSTHDKLASMSTSEILHDVDATCSKQSSFSGIIHEANGSKDAPRGWARGCKGQKSDLQGSCPGALAHETLVAHLIADVGPCTAGKAYLCLTK